MTSQCIIQYEYDLMGTPPATELSTTTETCTNIIGVTYQNFFFLTLFFLVAYCIAKFIR